MRLVYELTGNTRISENKTYSATLFNEHGLQAPGVRLLVRLRATSFLSRRHPHGQTGEGMRILRIRPYGPGQDNPRDIDKFMSADAYWVNEWETESQAVIRKYVGPSYSMNLVQAPQ